MAPSTASRAPTRGERHIVCRVGRPALARATSTPRMSWRRVCPGRIHNGLLVLDLRHFEWPPRPISPRPARIVGVRMYSGRLRSGAGTRREYRRGCRGAFAARPRGGLPASHARPLRRRALVHDVGVALIFKPAPSAVARHSEGFARVRAGSRQRSSSLCQSSQPSAATGPTTEHAPRTRMRLLSAPTHRVRKLMRGAVRYDGVHDWSANGKPRPTLHASSITVERSFGPSCARRKATSRGRIAGNDAGDPSRASANAVKPAPVATSRTRAPAGGRTARPTGGSNRGPRPRRLLRRRLPSTCPDLANLAHVATSSRK